MKEYVRVSEGMMQSKGRSSTQRIIVRTSFHVLYLLFNSVCMGIYGYQIYLWIRQGIWTKIPSHVLLPPGVESRLSTLSGVFRWILNVELAYTLCAIAMILFAFRWLADRKGK